MQLDRGLRGQPWPNWFYLALSALFLFVGLLSLTGAIQIVDGSSPTPPATPATPATPTSPPEEIRAEIEAMELRAKS
jgi:hypothetical protein